MAAAPAVSSSDLAALYGVANWTAGSSATSEVVAEAAPRSLSWGPAYGCWKTPTLEPAAFAMSIASLLLVTVTMLSSAVASVPTLLIATARTCTSRL